MKNMKKVTMRANMMDPRHARLLGFNVGLGYTSAPAAGVSVIHPASDK